VESEVKEIQVKTAGNCFHSYCSSRMIHIENKELQGNAGFQLELQQENLQI